MDFGAIQTDHAQAQSTGSLRQQQDLHEQFSQFAQITGAKGGDGVVVGMHVASQKAEGGVVVGGGFDFTGTEDTGSIAVEEQPQQEFGGVSDPAALGIALVDRPEIELG